MDKENITNTLRIFTERRDDLLHEDSSGFGHYLSRFLEICENNELLQSIIKPINNLDSKDVENWWKNVSKYGANFPKELDDDFALRYSILESVNNDPNKIFDFGIVYRKKGSDEKIDVFRSIVIRPVCI